MKEHKHIEPNTKVWMIKATNLKTPRHINIEQGIVSYADDFHLPRKETGFRQAGRAVFELQGCTRILGDLAALPLGCVQQGAGESQKRGAGMNNDRLKFRVWDTENECYQQDDADETFIRHTGKLVCVFWGDCDTMPTEYVEQEKAIVEFCTGLKDKNGNLIYDGDLLKSPRGKIRTVRWVSNNACFMAFPESNWGPVLACAFNVSEIVGNIHEGVKK